MFRVDLEGLRKFSRALSVLCLLDFWDEGGRRRRSYSALFWIQKEEDESFLGIVFEIERKSRFVSDEIRSNCICVLCVLEMELCVCK